ncbi:Uncharacterized protein APZ42_003510 [Daphnia magna]|uniref:Uncharacterized protein n=1 Tax=Daphnia magna TaxID=35525 RepID=A0A162CWS6_9CRUS|nr:Uncharacterized protein APZ42_003510 [Daphnia magna]
MDLLNYSQIQYACFEHQFMYFAHSGMSYQKDSVYRTLAVKVGTQKKRKQRIITATISYSVFGKTRLSIWAP